MRRYRIDYRYGKIWKTIYAHAQNKERAKQLFLYDSVKGTREPDEYTIKWVPKVDARNNKGMRR